MSAQEQPHEHKHDHRWIRRCTRCGKPIWLDRDHIADGSGYYHAACYYALCLSAQNGKGGADHGH